MNSQCYCNLLGNCLVDVLIIQSASLIDLPCAASGSMAERRLWNISRHAGHCIDLSTALPSVLKQQMQEQLHLLCKLCTFPVKSRILSEALIAPLNEATIFFTIVQREAKSYLSIHLPIHPSIHPSINTYICQLACFVSLLCHRKLQYLERTQKLQLVGIEPTTF